MKRPYFTIIVVAYNPGEDLDKTIDSIRKQSFKNYRIIIKDGGSTDGSLERAAALFGIEGTGASSDGRCHIIKGKDHGIYDAMNIAINALKKLDEQEENISRPGFVYFLNCGDVFSGPDVLQKVYECITRNERVKGTTLPYIYYGDIFEMQTMQRVSSVPKIDDFACYRNVPSHQACFYDERLMLRYPFDTVWKVRADYEHFLRCFYVEKAQTEYMKLLIADYEGGGFSETCENRKISENERQQIIHLYLSRKKIQKYDLIRLLTLASLRTKIAQNPKTAGIYNKLKSFVYNKRS